MILLFLIFCRINFGFFYRFVNFYGEKEMVLICKWYCVLMMMEAMGDIPSGSFN